MAVALDDGGVIQTQELYATPELHGRDARGTLIIDWHGRQNKSPNVRFLLKYKQERFEELLHAGIQHSVK